MVCFGCGRRTRRREADVDIISVKIFLRRRRFFCGEGPGWDPGGGWLWGSCNSEMGSVPMGSDGTYETAASVVGSFVWLLVAESSRGSTFVETLAVDSGGDTVVSMGGERNSEAKARVLKRAGDFSIASYNFYKFTKVAV